VLGTVEVRLTDVGSEVVGSVLGNEVVGFAEVGSEVIGVVLVIAVVRLTWWVIAP
jgi:hypothetical protein